VLGMTGIAAHAQETMLETPALEVPLELLLHIPRQVRALRRQVRLECGIVFLDELIKEGAPGGTPCNTCHILQKTAFAEVVHETLPDSSLLPH
jgi:hypothetical protein